MSRKTRLSVGALGVALAALLASGTVAVAGGLDPSLGSPNHKSVAPGRVKLKVILPVAAASHGVFISIQSKRKLVHGHLTTACNNPAHGCFYANPTKHDGHTYVYTAPGGSQFPGWWAVTAGKYYWQAEYFTVGDVANYYSKIGTFKVR